MAHADSRHGAQSPEKVSSVYRRCWKWDSKFHKEMFSMPGGRENCSRRPIGHQGLSVHLRSLPCCVQEAERKVDQAGDKAKSAVQDTKGEKGQL